MPSCEAPRNVLPSAQSTQPFRTSAARLSGGHIAEIQIERMKLGNSRRVVRELIRIGVILPRDTRRHIVAVIVCSTHRVNLSFARRKAGTPDTAAT